MKKYSNACLFTNDQDMIIKRLIATKHRERIKTQSQLEREVIIKHHRNLIFEPPKIAKLKNNQVNQELLSPIRLKRLARFAQQYFIPKSTSQKIKMAKSNFSLVQSVQEVIPKQKNIALKQNNRQFYSQRQYIMKQIKSYQNSNSKFRQKDFTNIKIIEKQRNNDDLDESNINNSLKISSLKNNEKIHKKIENQSTFKRYQNKLNIFERERQFLQNQQLSLPLSYIKQISLSVKPTFQIKYSDNKYKVRNMLNKRQLKCVKQKQFLSGWQSETFFAHPYGISLNINFSNKNEN